MKILGVTGIRSEYDYLFPVLNELRKYKHDVKVVISGAHLSHSHNNTWKNIQKDKFKISDKIDTLVSTNRVTQRCKGVSLIISGLIQTVERENPDFLIVTGDREESIATAIVGNYMQKLVVHIGGGDPAFGNADDPIRFAVSKLAHIHCCTSDPYKRNLIKIGEEKFRIFNTGIPSYSNIKNEKTLSRNQLFKKLKINKINRDYIVLIKHPLSSELHKSYEQMHKTLKALKLFCEKNNIITICIAPNSDPGSYDMIKAINIFKKEDWLHYYETLSRNLFINLIRKSKILVGNSSMGILESPYYKIPVVNIGKRQIGRLNAGNVTFTSYGIENIIKALNKSFDDKKYLKKVKNLKNPYGNHESSKNIRSILESIDTSDKKWYVKKKLC